MKRVFPKTAFFCVYRKNGFVELSKNLARYKSENNFIELAE